MDVCPVPSEHRALLNLKGRQFRRGQRTTTEISRETALEVLRRKRIGLL